MTTTTLPPRDHGAAHTGNTPPNAAASVARTSALLAALIGALAWNVLQVGTRTDDDTREAPPLTFPEPRCSLPSAEPQELVARSARLAAAAGARIDRYPFRPAEGLPALRLLYEASACAAQAGSDTDASALRARADGFRRRVEADYRDRLLRVERALAEGEPRRARADVDALASQLEGEDHAFARRMRNLRSTLADGGRK